MPSKLTRFIQCLLVFSGLWLAVNPVKIQAATEEESQLDLLRQKAGVSTNFLLPTPLVFSGREVAVFRTNLFGIPPVERAANARYRIKNQVAAPSKGEVSLAREPQGIMVTVDGRAMFGLTAGDLNPLDEITLEQSATNAMGQLQQVIQDEKKGRSLRGVILALTTSTAMTGLLVLIFWVINHGGKWLTLRLTFWTSKEATRLAASAGSGHAYRRTFGDFWDRTIVALSWFLRLLAVWLWLTYVLEQFPLTRPVGDYFKDYLELASRKGLTEMIKVIPDLLVVAVIFYITRFLSQLVTLLFSSITEERTKVTWLDANAAPTTQRIVLILLWLLALVMAYPYLPGSGTQAFRAVTVFAGLLLSLGSSSVVNQISSGLLLVYSRAVKPGEYIRVGETEGTVIRIGLVATSVRSIKNETISVPNTGPPRSRACSFTPPLPSAMPRPGGRCMKC
jgi:small-conductance mechanosensitive channel